MPAAQVHEGVLGRARGQHRGPSGQDRVQPDRRPVSQVHQRVGDQTADAQRGRAARRPPPGRRLEGSGLQPGCRGGGHGVAEAGAADGRGQRDPAHGGRAVLAAGHRPANQDGLLHHGPGVRAPLGVVAGEQFFPGLAGEHVGDLPGQVAGVAQPGAQALADERRGEVGGVAEEEGPPGLEPGGQPGAEGVAGAADDLQPGQVVLPGPGPQQPAEGLRGDQAGLVLAVVQLELPAVAVAGDVHEGGGPGGVADLFHAVPGVEPATDPDVNDQPPLGEPEVFHGDPGQVPDRAPRAVAAQYQASGERAHRLTRRQPRGHLDRGGGQRPGRIVIGKDLGPAAEADQRMLRNPGQQELFQVGLVEHVGLRVAVQPGLVPAEFGHHPVLGVEQAQPAARPGPGQEFLADADAVQDPGHLVVEVHRAGQRVRLGVPFQQGDRDPGAGEQQGCRGADRAGADHDDGLGGAAGHRGGGLLVLHGGAHFLAGRRRWRTAAYCGVRTARANPARAACTWPESAPVTVTTSRLSSYSAVTWRPASRPAWARVSVAARTAASAASAGL